MTIGGHDKRVHAPTGRTPERAGKRGVHRERLLQGVRGERLRLPAKLQHFPRIGNAEVPGLVADALGIGIGRGHAFWAIHKIQAQVQPSLTGLHHEAVAVVRRILDEPNLGKLLEAGRGEQCGPGGQPQRDDRDEPAPQRMGHPHFGWATRPTQI